METLENFQLGKHRLEYHINFPFNAVVNIYDISVSRLFRSSFSDVIFLTFSSSWSSRRHLIWWSLGGRDGQNGINIFQDLLGFPVFTLVSPGRIGHFVDGLAPLGFCINLTWLEAPCKLLFRKGTFYMIGQINLSWKDGRDDEQLLTSGTPGPTFPSSPPPYERLLRGLAEFWWSRGLVFAWSDGPGAARTPPVNQVIREILRRGERRPWHCWSPTRGCRSPAPHCSPSGLSWDLITTEPGLPHWPGR